MRKFICLFASVIAGSLAATSLASAQTDRLKAGTSKASLGGEQQIVSGAPCKTGVISDIETLAPKAELADPFTQKTALALVITKECSGIAIATFSAEVTTLGIPGGYVHLDIVATCTATGGFANACTPGQRIIAAPGHTYFQNGGNIATEANSMTMHFPPMKKGRWRFEAKVGGEGGNVGFRTFTVQTY